MLLLLLGPLLVLLYVMLCMMQVLDGKETVLTRRFKTKRRRHVSLNATPVTRYLWSVNCIRSAVGLVPSLSPCSVQWE